MDEEQYFLYENRLASFHGPQPITKRRQSNASSRAPKSLTWPHKFLRAEDSRLLLQSVIAIPDNVECFLCHKCLDGWEQGDNPALEHWKHAQDCGWAIVAAIEADVGDLGKVDPRDPAMVEARKATFAGRWPHEKRKGWKCKTKQLVEAGWKYTPTLDSDDNTTCTYCQLALDGWEAADKPMDEHSRRAPDCPFFQLINSNPAPPKKRAKSKAARGSISSRLSTQSFATAISDMQSVADLGADMDDTVMTTTSVMTQGKKTTKGRKTAATKGRAKTRTKKDEAVEVAEDVPAQEEEVPPPPPPKPTRGKKRGSDAMEDSVVINAEAPAPKKRATRAHTGTVADDDISMAEVAPPPARKVSGRKKARTSTSTTRSKRKGSSASIMSTASTASLRAHAPDDDEIDRQLHADLERPLTDDEDIVMDSDSERRKGTTKQSKSTKAADPKKAVAHSQNEEKADFAMFDPSPVEHDDAALEAELREMVAKTVVDKNEDGLPLPKKGRKAVSRKVSKQTKAAKNVQATQPDGSVDEFVGVPVPEAEIEQVALNASIASNATVVKGDVPPVKRPRGRPPKKSNETKTDASEAEKKLPLPDNDVDPLNAEDETTVFKASQASTRSAPRINKSLPPPPAPTTSTSSKPRPTPATPRANQISPAPSAKQPALSPSQSPQSSDAENQPPSSKPATSASAKRVALAPLPVPTTPRHNGSPSRRNVIAGLQSTTPWAAADLDLVFVASPSGVVRADSGATDKENGVGRLLQKGTQLTSPEKRMTVEEWIYHNAGVAEQRLKGECEAMVTAFEREGDGR